jgi:benzoyl-CoA reductase subunit C
MMESILQEFMDISDEPYRWLSKQKQVKGTKLIACYPMYVPEEIIHASGAIPFIIQRSKDLITLSPRWLQPFYCDFSRSTLDLLLKGSLNFVDGIIIGDTCYVNQGLYHILTKERPDFFKHALQLPKDLQRVCSRDLLREEFQRFREVLEQFTGSPISNEALRKSIEVYNENREAMKRLYALRRKMPGAIKAREIQAIVKSSMLMPKQEHTQRLKELLPQLAQRKPLDSEKPKLLISGCMCEDVLVDILDFVEDLGAVIVDDDLYMGYRYFAVDCEPNTDPIDSLVQRYLRMIPCPTRYYPDWDWGMYLVNRAKETEAQGVVIIVVTHCEPHWYAYPNLKNKLQAAGIPHFYLESEQESLSLGKIRTKVEAFMEMVKGGL